MKEITWVALVLYWSSGLIFSIFGIAEFWIATKTYCLDHSCPETDSNDLSGWIYLYMVTRFVMGIVQLTSRLFVLYPARLKTSVATRLTHMMHATEGVDFFYDCIVKCNFGIIACIILSGVEIQEITTCRNIAASPDSTADTNSIRSLEIASMITLTYVLFIRAVAAHFGKTRIWFRLAWPDQTAPTPSQPQPQEQPSIVIGSNPSPEDNVASSLLQIVDPPIPTPINPLIIN